LAQTLIPAGLATMQLDPTDQAFLYTLAFKVRTASLDQVAKHFYGSSASTSRRVGRLEQAGLVETYSLFAAVPEPPSAPLTVWSRADPRPDFGQLAYLLTTRWSELEVQAVKGVIAAKRYGRSVGGQGGRKSRLAEGTHDLYLTSVYLAQTEERQQRWQAEEGKTQQGLKKPDATIEGENVAVEIGGSSYTALKLEGLFTWCAQQGMAVELW
jgi:hypothetical protein